MSQYLGHRQLLEHKCPKKGQIYHFDVDIYASKNFCIKDIDSRASMILQNYQKLIEITSNMIYIVALGVGLKCLRKIHLNTQCPPPLHIPMPTGAPDYNLGTYLWRIVAFELVSFTVS